MTDELRRLRDKAVGHHQAGQLQAAESLYRQVLEAQPDDIETQYLLGTALLQLERFEECIKLLGLVAAAQPDVADLQNNLGVAYKALGQWEPAVRAFEAALRSNPDYEQALFNLGALMEDRGLSADAEKCYRRGLHLKPDDTQTLYTLGNVLRQQAKWSEAENCYRNVAQRNPENLDIQIQLGFVLVRQQKFDEAIEVFQRVLELRPDYHEVHNNLSYVYERQGRLEQAVSAARRAITINPQYAEGHNNLGTALKSLRRLEEACDCFRKALELQPQFPLAEFNLGTAKLLQGDFAGGWTGYDRRSETLGQPQTDYGKPRWDGSPLQGRSILLHAEQGFGDTFQFMRYAPLVKQHAGRVIVHCQKPLTRLLSRCPGIDQLIVEGDDLPEFDVHAPLLSLPRILKTTSQSIPADLPYIFADPQLVERWKQELAAVDGLKVGICWQGNPEFRQDGDRSIRLKHFTPLAGIAGVSLISLQKGDGVDQLQEVAGQLPVKKLGDDFDESSGAFMDTAAVMMKLDLVVTSDTAIPHLAGALGVPVWVALSYLPEWRWMLDRSDSPWYPSMRLFRQTVRGDWDRVFKKIAEQLRQAVSSGGT